MQKYDSNCTTRTNWFDLAGTHCTLSEPEPLNAFESIEGLLNTEIDDLCLPAYFWEQSDTLSPWNLYWTVPGYTGPAPMDLSAGRRRISDEERAKRFADGRCLYCGGFNHRAAECAARKKAQTFKAAGAEVKEVGTREGSEESGKD